MDTMSDEFEMDSAFFQEVDEITNQALSSQKNTPNAHVQPEPSSESFGQFDSFAFDDIDLMELDRLEAAATGRQSTLAFTSAAVPPRLPSRQTTLFGGVVPPKPSTNTFKRTASQQKTPVTPAAKEPKLWPQGAFIKHGWKMPKRKKCKHTTANSDDEDDNVEFEQFPNAVEKGTFFDSGLSPTLSKCAFSTPTSMKLKVDRLAAQNWLFPINREKRDYQFNIIKNSLFENCMVALPTGLGKTFIAAVVMFNYYRWFPGGKLIFVAPTRPLVNQQIEACHNVCGIPQDDCAIMIGNTKAHTRVSLWLEKRVYFMTPQMLQIELQKNAVDPTDIVLLVIDEAHRGTGNYAYTQVVRYLMHTNPFIRILALTATPANNLEKAQEIIDCLHISRIEMRKEDSLDIRGHVHQKEIKKYTIELDDKLSEVHDTLVGLMKIVHEPLKDILRLSAKGYTSLHPYRCQRLLRDPVVQRCKLYQPVRKLGTLTRAMASLMEGSAAMSRNILSELTGSFKIRIAKDLHEKLLALLAPFCDDHPPVHPKQSQVKSIALEHFTTSQDIDSGRIIVFASFREYVAEIVKHLNEEGPIIRATPFVGQSSGKAGDGMSQKVQLEVLEKFKKNEYNVLVATCVAEEGLDIGEVDAVICYDIAKDSIRALQRAGRTGRKKNGCVHVLMAKEREEGNWEKALESYHEVQKQVQKGKHLELYTDVSRLIPDDIRPQALETEFRIEEFVHQTNATACASGNRGTGSKRKRNSNLTRNIPEGASVGFVKAAALKPTREAKGQRPRQHDFSKSLSDSDDDKIVMAGPQLKRRRVQGGESVIPQVTAKLPTNRPAISTVIDNNESSGSDLEGPPINCRATFEGLARRNKMLLSSPDPASQKLSGRAHSSKNVSRKSTSPDYLSPLQPTDSSNIPSLTVMSGPHPSSSAEMIQSTPPVTQPLRIGKRRRIQFRSSSPTPSIFSPPRLIRRTETIEVGPSGWTEGVADVDENQIGMHHSLFDDEAIQSGTNTSESNDEVEEKETEEDRRFLEVPPETQIPLDYQQTQVYKQSMFTQPTTSNGPPRFRGRPNRHPKYARLETSKKREGVSSSPPRYSEPDTYEYDGFVIPD